jgi:hypothetical protein
MGEATTDTTDTLDSAATLEVRGRKSKREKRSTRRLRKVSVILLRPDSVSEGRGRHISRVLFLGFANWKCQITGPPLMAISNFDMQ